MDEAEVFELVKQDNHSESQCPEFGHFVQGKSEFQEPETTLKSLKTQPPKILIEGRTLQQVELLEKVLSGDSNQNQSRVTQITGFYGIGKSALACASVNFIQERALFNGGCVYMDAKDFENFTLFRDQMI